MNCFEHENLSAVAVCKSCGRGACKKCARFSDYGAACSTECIEYGSIQHDLTNRVLNIYGLGGQKPKLISNTLLLNGGMGLAFIVFGLVDAIRLQEFDETHAFPIFMGLAFILVGLIAHRRNKQNGLNC